MGNPTDVDMGGLDLIVNSVKVGATKPGQAGTTLSSTELAYLDTVVAGTVTASKAAVVDANKDLASLRNLTLTGTLAGAVATLSSTLGVTGVTTPTGGLAVAAASTASPRLIHTGGTAAQVSTDFTDQTPVITEVYFSEVFIPHNVTVTGVSLFRGSVSSGNYKVGLANSAGVVVATSATTASSGTDAYVDVSFTGTYAAIGPATYYVLAFYDNTTVRANTHTIGRFVAGKQTGQVYATGFTTITPGTSFTTALGPVATLF